MICYHEGIEIYEIKIVGDELHFRADANEHQIPIERDDLVLNVIEKYLDRKIQ